jgi:hypothetical protein
MPPGAAPTKATATHISTMEIAVRVGDSPKGACYALTDVTGNGGDFGDAMANFKVVLQWAADPNKVSNPKWVNRLWNTCAAMHILSEGKGTVWFFHHVLPSAERYHVKREAEGDAYTFSKVGAVTQEKVLKEAKPIDMTGMSIQELYNAVFDELARLAG